MTLFVIGRVIFGLYFFYSGFNHFKDEKMLTGYAKSKGVPSARLAVLGTGAMMIVGSLGFLAGEHLKSASALLLVFLVPTTVMMHSFWKTKDPMHKMNDIIGFTKNLALIGALLMVLGGGLVPLF